VIGAWDKRVIPSTQTGHEFLLWLEDEMHTQQLKMLSNKTQSLRDKRYK
jgi:hypothetical protein